jgi:DNA-directed RNA polymerase
VEKAVEPEAEANAEATDPDIAKEQQRLRKKVTELMKKQKVRQVRHLVKKQDNARPWGQDAHAKVCFFFFFSLTNIMG